MIPAFYFFVSKIYASAKNRHCRSDPDSGTVAHILSAGFFAAGKRKTYPAATNRKCHKAILRVGLK